MDKPSPSHSSSSSRGMLRPRDTARVVAQSGAYSRAVGVLRWVLPTLVLLILAGLIIWPMLRTKQLSAVVAASVPNLVVENLHLTGLSVKDEPYLLTATRALQAAENRNFIDLEKPEGELMLNNGAWVAGKANLGRFDQGTQRLWLGGNVRLFHDDGHQITTDDMQVDLKKNLAWGEQPVVIQGPFGEIHGQGFRFLDGGESVIVTGRATARLNLREIKPSDKPVSSSNRP